MKVYVYHLVIYPNNLQKYAKGNPDIYNLWNPSLNDPSENMISSILEKLDYYTMDNGKMIYTYAITDNKKYAKIFESTHDMKLFKKSIWNMSKKEYDDYKNRHNEPILANNKISKNHSIIMTNIEHDVISNESADSIMWMLTFFAVHDYSLFDQKYIIALDKLLYCTLYKIYGFEDDEENSFYEYNFQYGITAEQTTSNRVSLSIKFESVYIGLLLPFLNKDGIVSNK